ncbi:hypothetical protein EDD15DRAFT_453618 [Pisolithus albus]|nr:hypothetical protein EDD15DRAFT_453618 [Pisolithus albus]
MDPASIIIRSRPYWRGNATVFKVPRPQRTCSTQAVSAHPHDEQSFNPVVCSPIRRPRPRSHSYILPYILGQRGDSLRACRWNGARLEVKLCMTTPLPEKAGAESIDGSGSTSTAERNTQRYEDQGGQSVDTGTMRDDVWKEINSANKRLQDAIRVSFRIGEVQRRRRWLPGSCWAVRSHLPTRTLQECLEVMWEVPDLGTTYSANKMLAKVIRISENATTYFKGGRGTRLGASVTCLSWLADRSTSARVCSIDQVELQWSIVIACQAVFRL